MISIQSEERFFTLHDEPNRKVKQIEVDPLGRPSYQYYYKHSEA